MTRGDVWVRALFDDPVVVAGYPPSVRVIDGTFGGAAWRAVAIVADSQARFPRAREGQLGLDEGLAVADAVRSAPRDAAILAVVDVPGQAFGRREEAAGISLSLAAAVDAYATQRRAGRPIFALVVGKAISGAFLAHGLQAGWIGALRDPDIEVHVMSAASVARVTRASPEEVARVATIVPATARDIETFARFGAIDALFAVADPFAPTGGELAAIARALVDARSRGDGTRAPRERLDAAAALQSRAPARDVRARIARAWNA